MNTAHGERGELFLEPPGADVPEEHHRVADDSEEAMHQLRDPFRAEPTDGRRRRQHG